MSETKLNQLKTKFKRQKTTMSLRKTQIYYQKPNYITQISFQRIPKIEATIWGYLEKCTSIKNIVKRRCNKLFQVFEKNLNKCYFRNQSTHLNIELLYTVNPLRWNFSASLLLKNPIL